MIFYGFGIYLLLLSAFALRHSLQLISKPIRTGSQRRYIAYMEIGVLAISIIVAVITRDASIVVFGIYFLLIGVASLALSFKKSVIEYFEENQTEGAGDILVGNALSGLGAARKIGKKKAEIMKVASSMTALKRKVGKAAYEQGLGNDKAVNDVKAAQLEMNNETNKAKGMLAKRRLLSAYEILGGSIVVNNIDVDGQATSINEINDISQQMVHLREDIEEAGAGLKKNKVGMIAVAAVLLVILGGGIVFFTHLGNKNKNGKGYEEERQQEIVSLIEKCIALAESSPEVAAKMLADETLNTYRINELIGNALLDLSPEDQKKFAKIQALAEPIVLNKEAELRARERIHNNTYSSRQRSNSESNDRYAVESEGVSGTGRVDRDGSIHSSFQSEGMSARGTINADGTGYAEYDIGGQKVKVKINSDGSGTYELNGQTVRLPAGTFQK